MTGHHGSEQSPVSFKVHVERLPRKGMPVIVEAAEKQCGQLAEEHGLLAVESYRADMLVEPWKRGGVKVSGRVDASVVQACVVTLDPLVQVIGEPFEAVLLPEESKLGREGFGEGGEILLDAEGPDSPELFSGDTIDVGALAEQFFALAIDPYPRKAGAELAAAAPAPGSDVADWQQKLGALKQNS